MDHVAHNQLFSRDYSPWNCPVAPVISYAHSDLRGHMVQHLLLGMFAPLALVLGAPGTLLLRSIRTEVARRLVALLDTRPVRFLIHPVTAVVLDMGAMCLLYLSPLYVISTTNPTIHFLVHLHFVLSGYLYTWSIAGPEVAARESGHAMEHEGHIRLAQAISCQRLP